jgi:hypothetical protein
MTDSQNSAGAAVVQTMDEVLPSSDVSKDPAQSSHAIFISYSSQDRVVAEAICDAFEANAIGCWIAPRDVRAGRVYSGQITQAIREARVLLVVLSEAANRSRHVLHEVERAFHFENHLVTFRSAKQSLVRSR